MPSMWDKKTKWLLSLRIKVQWFPGDFVYLPILHMWHWTLFVIYYKHLLGYVSSFFVSCLRQGVEGACCPAKMPGYRNWFQSFIQITTAHANFRLVKYTSSRPSNMNMGHAMFGISKVSLIIEIFENEAFIPIQTAVHFTLTVCLGLISCWLISCSSIHNRLTYWALVTNIRVSAFRHP